MPTRATFLTTACATHLQRSRGEGNRGELLSLYDDPNPAVQCWAAAHTLELDEAMALTKLEQLETPGIPVVSLDAE